MDAVVVGWRADRRAAARSSTLLAGVVAVVAMPIWGIFDWILVPAQARQFLLVRVVAAVFIAATWLALRSTRPSDRRCEVLAVLLTAWVQLAIAWMLPRVGDDLEPYLLGHSLAIYASAFLLAWRWEMTASLVAVTALSTGLAVATAPSSMTLSQHATIVFYLSTAGALAIAAQVYRQRNDLARFLAQASLAAERDRNAELVAELDALSRQDPLTGVGNRRAWEGRLEHELGRAARTGAAISVIVGDLDHFKVVNDTLGHAAGDRVLRAALELVTSRARSTDFVARLGGDEFSILCPDTGLVDAEALAADLLDCAANASWPHGLIVSFSLGVAEARPGENDQLEILQRADRALYEAKSTRNTVRVA